MLKILLFLAIVGFVGFAILSQYNKTPAEDSVPKRVWTSLVAAGTALGALVTDLFKSVAIP